MRKLITFLLLFCSLSMLARGEKEYREIIEKYDIYDTIKNLKSGNPEDFWRLLRESDVDLQRFNKEQSKNKGLMKKTSELLRDNMIFYPQYSPYVIEDSTKFGELLCQKAGIVENNIYFVCDYEPGAYTILTEKGFAICISPYLLKLKGLSNNMLLGIVAHEYAHGLLKHIERATFEQKKKERKNKTLKIIGGVLAVSTEAVAAYYGGQGGVYTPSLSEDTFNQLDEIEAKSSLKFKFNYSKAQEFQADLTAYRFLEWMGYGDMYIEVLRCLAGNLPSYDDNFREEEYSEHPKLQDRIDFLKFVKEHPTLGRKGPKTVKQAEHEEKFSDPIYENYD